ncbi:hypothetical protein AN219_21255 [Streptomyces nanshensis]|nr:hypothetical protein AN219_21255 [Streptomyces nanshensis]
MLHRNARHLGAVFLALVVLTGVSSNGCSDGVPSGRPGKGDDFDQDDIRVAVVECASKKRPSATVKVRANTSPKDRRYFVGVEFLDSKGRVVDSSSQKLTPQPDSPDKDEITANVKFPMSEPKKAGQVTSCKMDHAF